MADISQIKLPNGDTFDLVDEKSGYLTVETDPVFSVSAAAGITSTDISNWNGKSDSDEKLKTTLVTQSGQTMYPIFSLTSTTRAENKLIDTNFTYLPQSTSVSLTLGSSGSKAGQLALYNGTGYIILHSSQLTSGVKNIYLPAQNGTVALTSDIPAVYSSTNTGGYLTMATLPIYDGTVV